MSDVGWRFSITRSSSVQRTLENAGQTLHYLTSEQFRALTTADYKFKGELIHRLGLAAQ